MAKRKDIEAILEDENLDIKAKVTKLLDLQHEDIDAIRDERDTLIADLELANKNLTAANTAKEKAENDLTTFRTDIANKETRNAKETALRGVLKSLGMTDKRIGTVVKATSLDSIELDENGTIKGADEFTESIKSEWSEFIPTEETHGADVENPPKGNPGAVTKEQFKKMGYTARLELYNSQPELYNELNKE